MSPALRAGTHLLVGEVGGCWGDGWLLGRWVVVGEMAACWWLREVATGLG